MTNSITGASHKRERATFLPVPALSREPETTFAVEAGMWSLIPTRPGRFLGLMNEVERGRPSRITARRLGAVRRFLFAACAQEDEAKLRPLLDMVERDGHFAWIDYVHLPPGSSYANDAMAALYACRGVLVFCSTASYASLPVRREITAAGKLGKPIVPIILDDASMPDTFGFYLARWPAVRLDDPHWRVRLRSATEAIARGKRQWQGSPPISAECAPVMVVS